MLDVVIKACGYIAIALVALRLLPVFFRYLTRKKMSGILLFFFFFFWIGMFDPGGWMPAMIE